jgi:hypothetical protein
MDFTFYYYVLSEVWTSLSTIMFSLRYGLHFYYYVFSEVWTSLSTIMFSLRHGLHFLLLCLL